MRHRIRRHDWLMVPGAAVALFAIAAIVLPLGSDGLGAYVGLEPGVAPSLARWARDIHDGFWGPARPVMARVPERAVTTDRVRALELCAKGEAEAAVALYEQIGVLTPADEEALFELNEYLIVNGEYDRAEWYAPKADRLLGGGVLRNNLAWHYTQVNIRPKQALDLALNSVAEDRNACNVDTLAWAYYRNGEYATAESVAKETLDFRTTWLSGLAAWEEQEARRSSERLLQMISQDRHEGEVQVGERPER